MASTPVIKLAAACTLACSLLASVVLTPVLAGSVGRNGLAYTDRAEEGDPPQVALGIAMGAFRGVFVNFLWIRANTLKEQGKHFEAIELARAITQLQPRFPRVWAFHAWNMSYNISVTTQTPEERWTWVKAGIDLIRSEGIEANPSDMLLHKELAWIFLHKIGGYTDDANLYYKKQHAMEWHVVLGPPPAPDIADRSTAHAIQQYADWLRVIEDAPRTRTELADLNPAADQLAARLERVTGESLGFGTLQRWTVAHELDLRDGREDASIQGFAIDNLTAMGPKTSGVLELYQDPAYAAAWDDLIAFLRRKVLTEKYNMEPVRMRRLTERFGPWDWRLPAAHGAYWAERGVDVGKMEVDEQNTDAFDFVNTYRLVAQAVQDQWRYGKINLNYLDLAENKPLAYFTSFPNEHFVDGYEQILDQAQAESGIFEDERRPYRIYSAGYENFLEDVIEYFYRRGQTARAQFYYDKLRNYEGQNINDPGRVEKYALPLDQFVQRVLFDRYDSPQVAVRLVQTSLDYAFREALMNGDLELYRNMSNFARQAHTFFVNKQVRDTIVSGGNARMEFMNRDFRVVRGLVFVDTFRTLGPREAELLYNSADSDLRKWAYDYLLEFYAPILEATGEPRTFEQVFPEPEGMEEFRAEIRRLQEQQQRNAVDGIRSR